MVGLVYDSISEASQNPLLAKMYMTFLLPGGGGARIVPEQFVSNQRLFPLHGKNLQKSGES